MRRFRPSARLVAAWIAAAALAYALGMLILMSLGCRQPGNTFAGLDGHSLSSNQAPTCEQACSCPTGEFAPVCSSDGVTYLSPCIAGCSAAEAGANDGANSSVSFSFSDCKCLSPGVTLSSGSCGLECGNLVWYISVFSLFVLIHSTCEVGAMLLTLRCVEPRDKAMALGLVSVCIGLFGKFSLVFFN